MAGSEGQKKFPFDSGFQRSIAALAMRDSTFLGQIDGLVKPEYFEEEIIAHIFDITDRYYKEYKKAFGDFFMFGRYANRLCSEKKLKTETMFDAVRASVKLWNLDISDRQFVVDEIANFARQKAVEKAVMEIVEKHLDHGNFDVIQTLMTKALQVGAYSDRVGYDYGAGIEERTDSRIAKVNGDAPPETITTGYPEIDAHLPGGGWGRRELSMLMGRAKVGKSTALMDFALAACGSIHKYNVLYVTLEVSQKVISERADAHISNTAMNLVTSSNQSVKMAVQSWRDRAGKFVIEDFPTGTLKVSDLRRVIERYKNDGLVFDLVVVDYADLMAPERYNSNPQENSRTIWTDLRGLASTEGFALLTATQTNREGAKKITATMTDVAEDFNKIRICDVAISINKTEDEVMNHECRLTFVAVRNGPQDFSIRIKQNIGCMRFVTQVMGVE